jgi:hypothetical protein
MLNKNIIKIILIKDILNDSSKFQIIFIITEKNEIIIIKIKAAKAIVINKF